MKLMFALWISIHSTIMIDGRACCYETGGSVVALWAVHVISVTYVCVRGSDRLFKLRSLQVVDIFMRLFERKCSCLHIGGRICSFHTVDAVHVFTLLVCLYIRVRVRALYRIKL